jgi:hypothetical protein
VTKFRETCFTEKVPREIAHTWEEGHYFATLGFIRSPVKRYARAVIVVPGRCARGNGIQVYCGPVALLCYRFVTEWILEGVPHDEIP